MRIVRYTMPKRRQGLGSAEVTGAVVTVGMVAIGVVAAGVLFVWFAGTK
jgi:hypothetical protein